MHIVEQFCEALPPSSPDFRITTLLKRGIATAASKSENNKHGGFIEYESMGNVANIKAVAVYCGATHGDNPRYQQAARALGAELARRGLRLIYGGGSVGLMGEVATAALENGGQVTGVMPRNLYDLEIAHKGVQDFVITEDMATRKAHMEDLADAFIALPGGMGTLDELAQVLVRQQLGPATGPVALINVDGFWDPLLHVLQNMVDDWFVPTRFLDAIVVDADPAGALDAFDSWTPPALKWEEHR